MPAAVEHFSSQHPAEAAVFAQLLPSFPLQQEASSFPEQQEATSFPSFVLDFVCMQASVCLCDAELVPVAVLSQQEHFVSGVAFSGVDGAGVAVCAHEAIERIRKKAINLNFMTHISVYVKFWGALLRARSSSLIARTRKAPRVLPIRRRWVGSDSQDCAELERVVERAEVSRSISSSVECEARVDGASLKLFCRRALTSSRGQVGHVLRAGSNAARLLVSTRHIEGP